MLEAKSNAKSKASGGKKQSTVPEHFSHGALVRRLAVPIDLAEGL